MTKAHESSLIVQKSLNFQMIRNMYVICKFIGYYFGDLNMDVQKKLEILADAAKYDASCASSGSKRKAKKGFLGDSNSVGICHSYTPDGRCVSLLKVLFSNHCIFDCKYCVNRVTSDVPRASFTVKEIVDLTINFYKRNYIEGLFLSSGIFKDSDTTMNQLTEVAKKLRLEERFNGYIHLKAVAGASDEVLAEASLYADRLSANIELSEDHELRDLAPGKTHASVFQAMGKLKQVKNEGAQDQKSRLPQVLKNRLNPAGQSTQMIVGATSSADRSLLKKSNELYSRFQLKRVYYSSYSPIQKSSPLLPSKRPELVREHRLYQADWLMRFYGFSTDEIVPESHPHLSLDQDPKLSWALRNRHLFPVDVNTADKESLLRVPGLGVRNVQRILSARRFKKLRYQDLAKMNLQMSRAKYFLLTSDFNPYAMRLDDQSLEFKQEEQLSFFSERFSGLTGEV